METYLLLILMAGIVAMDTTGGPQMLLSEPLISCAVAGFLFGKPVEGLMIGMFFQLLLFGYLPLGAVRIPDGNMGAFIATLSLLIASERFGMTGDTAKASMLPAIAWGVVSGRIGSRIQAAVRRNNSRMSEYIINRIDQGDPVLIGPIHMLGLASSMLRGVAMAVLLVPTGVALCGLMPLLNIHITSGLATALPMLWCTACASAVIVSVLKGRTKPLIYGAIVGALWVLITINHAG